MSGGLRTASVYSLLIAVAAVSVFPFLFSALTSLREPGRTFAPGVLPDPPTLQNYIDVVRSTPLFVRWVGNSVVIGGVTVAVLVLSSLMAGYAFARIAFPGRTGLFLLMLASMMVPGQVLWIPNYATLASLGWVNSYLGLIPGFVGTLTAGIFLAAQSLKSFPRELEEAAMLDGLSRYATFVRVVLPLMGPVAAALAITGFMASWNAFAWPVIVLNSPELFTLPVGLNFVKGVYVTKWTLVMAASMFNTIPVLAVFILFQRYFIKGIATVGLKE
jgi:multiple sugar transport system permease protein